MLENTPKSTQIPTDVIMGLDVLIQSSRYDQLISIRSELMYLLGMAEVAAQAKNPDHEFVEIKMKKGDMKQ